MSTQKRINFLEGRIEAERTWISTTESLMQDAQAEIEEHQQNIENWKVYIGDKENNINELESELEVLREEQREKLQGVQDAEDRDWHSMKL